jgi:hypothetical protein
MAPIPITPEKHRAAQAPFRDISEEEAHPPLPRFLFRAFTAESQGLNSPNGFVCGRYAGARAPPPGPPESPDLNETLEHLDPSKTLLKCSKCQEVGKCCNKTLHQKIPSSYISTSSDLIWVIRKMISQGEESYISVIDTSTLDPLSVFYVPPYQRELARKQLFTVASIATRAIPSISFIMRFLDQRSSKRSLIKSSLLFRRVTDSLARHCASLNSGVVERPARMS